MAQEFVQVLQEAERDEPMDFVVRRFWARAKPLAVVGCDGRAPVADLAQWVRARRPPERR